VPAAPAETASWNWRIAMGIGKRLLSLLFGLGIVIASVGSATAATSDNAVVQITAISNAGLSASITGVTFPSVEYSFTDTTRTGSFVITALDNRGTALGWNIVLSATNFSNTAETRSFPVGQLSLAAGSIATNAGNTTLTGQSTFAQIPVTTVGGKIWNAAVGSGDGQYTMTSTGTLIVPGGTLVDTYSSRVTVSINSGP
jgi:hypothetical protein